VEPKPNWIYPVKSESGPQFEFMITSTVEVLRSKL